jgi:RNA recognition motif-containing protein
MSDSSSEENVNAPKVVKPIVDSDSSDDEVAPKPKAKAALAPAKAAVEDSSSDDDEPAPKPKAAPKAAPVKAAVEDSSSDDDEPAPKPKAKAAAKAAADDSSSEEEVVAAKPAVKVAVAPKPVVDSDSESDSPHKGQVAPKVQAAAADSDDSDDEVAVAPKAKVAVAPKAKVPAKDSDSSSEDDEPMAQVKAAQTKPEKNQTLKAKLDAAVEEPKQSSTVNTKQKGDDDTEDFRVIIKGLPFKAEEKDLKKDFSSCGSIKHVKVLQDDKGQSRGIAFIVFTSSVGVDAALQRDGDKEKYKGRTLSVARAEKRKGAPPGAENKRPEQNDKDRKRKTAEGGSSGSTADPNAILTKDTFQQMLRLQESKDFSSLEKMAAKIVKSCAAAQERARQEQGGANKKRQQNTVFVKGLPHTDFDDEAFQKRFQDCGDVKFVWLPKNADGDAKGFGTVSFKTEEAFQKALKYNGTKCKGGVLSVVKSEPKPKAAGEGSETKAGEQTPKRKKPSTEEVSSSEVVEKAAKKQKTDQKKQKTDQKQKTEKA